MNHIEGNISDPTLVCIPQKSFYGLKQAPRTWYAKKDSFLLSQNFARCKSDPNVYLHKYEGDLFIIVLHFDDFLITRSTLASINFIKIALHEAFDMSDLGLLRQFLGLEITQYFDEIMINQ